MKRMDVCWVFALCVLSTACFSENGDALGATPQVAIVEAKGGLGWIPEAGHVVMVVEVSVDNALEDSLVIAPTQFSVRASDGFDYPASLVHSAELSHVCPTDVLLSPGASTSCGLAFELEEGAQPEVLRFSVASLDGVMSEPVMVSFGQDGVCWDCVDDSAEGLCLQGCEHVRDVCSDLVIESFGECTQSCRDEPDAPYNRPEVVACVLETLDCPQVFTCGRF